jgi:putative transcriptional regulator
VASVEDDELPQRIRSLRTAANLTLESVAEAVGVDRSAVAHWEAGRNKPRADVLPRLARVLGVSVGVLFGEAA